MLSVVRNAEVAKQAIETEIYQVGKILSALLDRRMTMKFTVDCVTPTQKRETLLRPLSALAGMAFKDYGSTDYQTRTILCKEILAIWDFCQLLSELHPISKRRFLK